MGNYIDDLHIMKKQDFVFLGEKKWLLEVSSLHGNYSFLR